MGRALICSTPLSAISLLYEVANMTTRAIGATANRPPAVNPDPLPMGGRQQIEGSSIVGFNSFQE